MTIGIGIIGAGVVSDGHLQELQNIDQVEVRAIADLNEEARRRQADKYDIPVQVDDYRRLLDAAEVDVVYVCLPHFLHLPVTVDALQAGKHVVCEKPFAINTAEAQQMIDAARDAGRQLFIGENHRFLPVNIKAREILESGTIGRPFLGMSCFIGNEFERMNDPDSWKGTRDKSGGGVIIDNGFHVFDTMVSFMGEVAGVQASGGRLVVEAENKEEDTAVVSLLFRSAAVANLTLTFAARYSGFPSGYIGAGLRYDVYGTDGSLHLVNEQGFTLTLATGTGRETMSHAEIEQSLPAAVPAKMNAHFVDCLLNDREPVVTAEQSLHIVKIVDACYRSLETGRREEVK